jgi:hypothetical protein
VIIGIYRGLNDHFDFASTPIFKPFFSFRCWILTTEKGG